MKTRAVIFAPDADSGDFKQALTLGQGLPKEIDGSPAAYLWKEVLRPRHFIDASGSAHDVVPERIDGLLASFKKLAAKGKLPTLPSHHPQQGESKDALSNLGHVVDARKNDAGGLEVLCRFVGVDAIRASARNDASIGTLVDFTDADGESYPEIIDHVAVVPDPRLTDLKSFTPALAASDGPAVPAIILTPAVAPKQRIEPMLDLQNLRKVLSLADNVPDDQVILKAEEKFTTDATALTTAQTALAAEKALQLSSSVRTVDPEILNDRLGTFEERIDTLMERYKDITPEHKKIALELMAPAGKPSALMLSQSITIPSSPAASILKLLQLSATNPFHQKTGTQPTPRTTPGDNGGVDLLTEGKTAGSDYQKAALASRGLS